MLTICVARSLFCTLFVALHCDSPCSPGGSSHANNLDAAVCVATSFFLMKASHLNHEELCRSLLAEVHLTDVQLRVPVFGVLNHSGYAGYRLPKIPIIRGYLGYRLPEVLCTPEQLGYPPSPKYPYPEYLTLTFSTPGTEGTDCRECPVFQGIGYRSPEIYYVITVVLSMGTDYSGYRGYFP